ncbi:zinc finger MYM-type protein 1-like [Metopolophium dirhodum]|uniref:zinc finger MYM-type protein 1-like n=1 Tax=Metopolophium dirhodum TaxID=44670 RepID=UPI00299047D6|nr:zinc finger MYM-type protein 1-like [Metopolophium dirhodum]
MPDENFSFPTKAVMVGKEKTPRFLKFQFKWFSSYSWLVYSAFDNGAYCKFCVAFSKYSGGINNQSLGSLVIKKYDNWRHALEYFKNHSNLEYHKKCVLDADRFLNMVKNPTLSIDKQIDIGKAREVMKNRKNIVPIIEAIILCGRQNLALRGHRDSGKMLTCSDSEINNEGNFREIHRYRAQGDNDLKSYLEGPGTIKYTSATSQNAIIEACNKVLLDKIVSRVNASKCFSILADETADVSGVEQVSLCVRYVEINHLELREEFLQFVPTFDVTGKGLAKLIIDNLQKYGIDTKYLRGQGYDGAASMSGKLNGVQAHIKKIHPLAMYVHCSAHSLNLAVSKSCSAAELRDCLSTLGKVRDFFIYPKRKSVLHHQIESSSEISSKKTLKRSCETRWIERFHAVNDFIELYNHVIESLEIISEWVDSETSGKARILRNAVLNLEFLVSLFVLNKGFSIGLPLSKLLQNPNIDLKVAIYLDK